MSIAENFRIARRINDLISGTESTGLACAQRMKTLSIAAYAICRNEVTDPGFIYAIGPSKISARPKYARARSTGGLVGLA